MCRPSDRRDETYADRVGALVISHNRTVDAASIGLVCGTGSVCLSVCLSHRSTAAATAGGFAAERPASRKYRPTAAGREAARCRRLAANAGSVTLRDLYVRKKDGTDGQTDRRLFYVFRLARPAKHCAVAPSSMQLQAVQRVISVLARERDDSTSTNGRL